MRVARRELDKHAKRHTEHGRRGAKRCLQVLEKLFHALGITKVLSAGNGVDAIQLMEEKTSINLVLLDLQMPDKPGDEVLVELREVCVSEACFHASC